VIRAALATSLLVALLLTGCSDGPDPDTLVGRYGPGGVAGGSTSNVSLVLNKDKTFVYDDIELTMKDGGVSGVKTLKKTGHWSLVRFEQRQHEEDAVWAIELKVEQVNDKVNIFTETLPMQFKDGRAVIYRPLPQSGGTVSRLAMPYLRSQ
jgi:hypothetical protein